MRIAVDAYEINRNYTGVGRYTFDLINALTKIDKENEYTLFFKESSELSSSLKEVNKIFLPSEKGYTHWQNFILNPELKKGNFDLFFATNYSLPIFFKGKSVLTVHDISWKVLKNDYSLKERILKEIKSVISFKKASLIFTVSEFTKDEVVKYYKTGPNKIIAIHSAINDKFHRADEDEISDFKKRYLIQGEKLIGFLGSLFKRRHIKELIEVFKKLRKTENKFSLILFGKIYDSEVKELINSEGIFWNERIEDKYINAFYSSLNLFVYISEYEGFGFPPLEALKCGIPSLLLKSSSLKEIYEKIALFVENPSPEMIYEKLKEFFSNEKKYRDTIFSEFKKRENYFTWERAAKEYLENIKRLFK